MKVIVSQYGSRRRYMIPQILERRGLLHALYTDSNAQSLIGRMLSKLGKALPRMNRLAARQPQLPSDRIKSDDRLQLKIALCRFKKNKVESEVQAIFEGSAGRFIKWGVKGADWLYAMFIENFRFTEYAKRNGVKILTDIYEDPFIWDELVKEISMPEYECISYQKVFYQAQSKLRHQYIDKLLETADQYLIPSGYVARRLSLSPKFDQSKVNIVPYASSVKAKEYSNRPIKGRIIWVGNDPVRKGLVYCAKSADILKQRYPELDFRIIGLMPEGLKESEAFKNLNFVGYCNKAQLQEEYRLADMLVFPTLGEGFSAGLLEAASFGVPILTTEASGFADDFPGIFIGLKNVEDIVNGVSNLIDNRSVRDSMSKAMFEYSQRQGNSFETNLVKILSEK